MSNLDEVKRKIQGILAKAADGSGATEEEANAALAFARRLMLRHQVSEADLGADGKRTPSEIAADTEYDTVAAFTTGASLSLWESTLGSAICLLVGTVKDYRGYRTERRSASGCLEFDANGRTKKAATLVFYGPAEDCRDARELFDEWSLAIAALARMKYGGALRGSGRSYAEGFARSLYRKAVDLRRAERASIGAAKVDADGFAHARLLAGGEAQFAPGQECSALVVAAALEITEAKLARASDWLRNEKGIRLRSGSRGGGGARTHDGEAYSAGARDGQNANFSRSTRRKLQ